MIAVFLAVAASAFGPAPCGAPTVAVSPMSLPPHTSGQAFPDRCHVDLDPGWWATMGLARRCHLVVHEYGHLAGAGHSDDRLSVMWPDDRGTLYAPCKTAARELRAQVRRRSRVKLHVAAQLGWIAR